MSSGGDNVGQGVEILVVEDSRAQALMLKQLLEDNGFIVHLAGDGVEAQKKLLEKTPRLVLSDIIMPEMDGYELSQWIKSNDKLSSIPVVLVTTLSDPDDIIRGLKCGANGFVTKPYDAQFLLSRIYNLLENLEMRQSRRSETGLEFSFAGERHLVTVDRTQILDLLLSTYETAAKRGRELERINRELQEAIDTIKALQGMLPICAGCKKIRDDTTGQWHHLETYIEKHSEATFTHGLCPDCLKRLYPQLKKTPRKRK
jgi:two-component system cell cycle response regulator